MISRLRRWAGIISADWDCRPSRELGIAKPECRVANCGNGEKVIQELFEEKTVILNTPAGSGKLLVAAASRVCHANITFVVAASGSQPRVGSLVIEETSLIEIWRPRVRAPFTSTSDGLQVCWLIF
ncbi:MAG: hypothetical protein HW373_1071 [Deltaproteobacteria bacterium]|nr:hypothetical protein [Deltaproteobacteria bacterium]